MGDIVDEVTSGVSNAFSWVGNQLGLGSGAAADLTGINGGGAGTGGYGFAANPGTGSPISYGGLGLGGGAGEAIPGGGALGLIGSSGGTGYSGLGFAGTGTAGGAGVGAGTDIALKGPAGLSGPLSMPASSAAPPTGQSAAGMTPSFDTQPNLPTAGATTSTAGTATPTPTAAAPGASAGGPTTSLGKFAADPSLSKFGDVIAANPGLAIGGLGLGASLLKGSSQPPELGALSAEAAQAKKAGNALTQPLLTGKLPPGAQASVDQSVASSIAQIRSEFANMGLSGSSMEATAIGEAQNRGQQLAFSIAETMAQTGLGETSLSADLLKSIMQSQLSSDAELQNAIVGFAQAAAGGGVQLKLA